MISVQAEAAVGRSFRRTIEKTLATITLIFGLGLTAFQSSFEYSPLSFLETLASPATWAVYLTALGAVRLAFLIVNGYYPHSPIVRAWLSFITLMTVWTPISAAFYYNILATSTLISGEVRFYPGAALAPGFIVIEGLSLYALLVLWKAHHDGRRDSEDHRGDSNGAGVDPGSHDRAVRRPENFAESRRAFA
jgi:hypothetical protein